MNEKPQNKTSLAIGNFVSSKLEQYDPYFFGLLAVIAVAKLLHFSLPTPIVVLPFSAAVIIYILSSFVDPRPNAFDSVIHRTSCYGSAVSALGQLYLLQRWPKGTNLIIVGFIILLISAVYIFIQNSKDAEIRPFHKWIFIRLVVLMAISGALIYNQFAV